MRDKSRLAAVLAFLPVLTGVLYLLGITHYQGYLDGFGLQESVLPLAYNRVLLEGLLSLLSIAMAPAILLGLALGCIVLAAIIVGAALNESWVRPTTKDSEARAPAQTGPAPAVEPKAKVLRLIGIVAALLILIPALLVFAAVWSSRAGSNQAREEQKKFAARATHRVLFSTTRDPNLHEALLISCTSTYCGFWLGADGAMVVSRDDMTRFYTLIRRASGETSAEPHAATATGANKVRE